MPASCPPLSVALVRVGAEGVPAPQTQRERTRCRHSPETSWPPQSDFRRHHARPDARRSHDSTPIVIPRVRRNRQRLRPNDSIESDPAIDPRAPCMRSRAGSLPIESYRFSLLCTQTRCCSELRPVDRRSYTLAVRPDERACSPRPVDQARKHRKRWPEEMEAMRKQLKARTR